MIISRAPFRISFFGGGTDLKSWFDFEPGMVVGATIKYYSYISCRRLPPFHPFKTKVVYSKIEEVADNWTVEHPAVRQALAWLGMSEGLEIHHMADLPGRSGIGSSSAFLVALLNALYFLRGEQALPDRLAETANIIERDLLKEHGGIQDPIIISHGGFNEVHFERGCEPKVIRFQPKPDFVNELERWVKLYFTGASRFSSEVSKSYGENPEASRRLVDIARVGVNVISRGDVVEFGKLLDLNWQEKKRLSGKISTGEIDAMYDAAKKAGAIGGKVIGAGGGGFLLLCAPPDSHEIISEVLDNPGIDIKFDLEGAKLCVM